ncbi:MAG: autotransporter domain-containing protein [Hyphomonadaceae bacterium]|nr:autotransporter domain-containing protein [Hyphomonadaceae bacterium]
MRSMSWAGRLLHACAALLGFAAMATTAAAQSRTAEVVFVVDESGSMGGEQEFLQTFVPALEQQLLAAGLISVRFGLVGFGDDNEVPRQFLIAGQPFGSAANFATAAMGLVTDGGTEDGYAGIQYVLDNYTFSGGTNTAVIVLVTDEDRDDITNGALTFQVVLVNLQNANVSLSAILNQVITGPGGEVGIGTNGIITYVDVNRDGVPEEVGTPTFGSAAGTTNADYTALVLSFENGCVADINQLRAGGPEAQAFAVTLARCLVQQALGGTGNDIFLSPAVTMGRAALLGHADALSFRLTGRYYGLDGMHTASNAAGTRRAFALLSYGQGEWEEVTGGQPGFDYDNVQFLAGFDADWGHKALVGFSLGYSEGESNSDASADLWEHRIVTFGVHASKEWENGFNVNGQALVGLADYDTSRAVSSISGPDTADGAPEANLYLLRARASRTYGLFGDRFDITPHFGVTHTKVDVDGYTEDGPGGLRVDGFSQELTTADIGIEAQTSMATQWGELRPSLQIGAEYALDTDDESVSITTPLGGGFQQLIPAYEDLTGVAGIGATLISDDGDRAIRFGYEGRFNEDGESHSLALRGRIRF